MASVGLYGTLPTQLGNLPRLKTLKLDRNQLSGTIPSELGNLESLMELDLSHNLLTGTISPTLVKLKLLTDFNVATNSFCGSPTPMNGDISNFGCLPFIQSLRCNVSSPSCPCKTTTKCHTCIDPGICVQQPEGSTKIPQTPASTPTGSGTGIDGTGASGTPTGTGSAFDTPMGSGTGTGTGGIVTQTNRTTTPTSTQTGTPTNNSTLTGTDNVTPTGTPTIYYTVDWDESFIFAASATTNEIFVDNQVVVRDNMQFNHGVIFFRTPTASLFINGTFQLSNVSILVNLQNTIPSTHFLVKATKVTLNYTTISTLNNPNPNCISHSVNPNSITISSNCPSPLIPLWYALGFGLPAVGIVVLLLLYRHRKKKRS